MLFPLTSPTRLGIFNLSPGRLRLCSPGGSKRRISILIINRFHIIFPYKLCLVCVLVHELTVV